MMVAWGKWRESHSAMTHLASPDYEFKCLKKKIWLNEGEKMTLPIYADSKSNRAGKWTNIEKWEHLDVLKKLNVPSIWFEIMIFFHASYLGGGIYEKKIIKITYASLFAVCVWSITSPHKFFFVLAWVLDQLILIFIGKCVWLTGISRDEHFHKIRQKWSNQ